VLQVHELRNDERLRVILDGHTVRGAGFRVQGRFSVLGSWFLFKGAEPALNVEP
jgi:hypothetical protein